MNEVFQKLLLFSMLASFFLSGCGGGGGCVDVYPSPNFDYMVHRGLDAADMNGDGLIDLVFSSSMIFGSDPVSQQCGGPTVPADGFVTVLLQDVHSPGQFLSPVRYSLIADRPSGIKLANLDNDTLADVIVAERWGAQTFEILLNDPQNMGTLLYSQAYNTVYEPNQIQAGDIDMDGLVDVVIAGENTVTWHRQNVNGSFITNNDIGPGQDTAALIDFNGDGLLDLATKTEESVSIYKQSTVISGSFELLQQVPINAIRMLGVGDLNEDNHPDIAVAGFVVDSNFNFSDVWFQLKQTSQEPLSFTILLSGLLAENSSYAPPLITDINGDGKEDVIIGGGSTAPGECEVTVFLQGETPGDFSEKAVYYLPSGEVTFTGPNYGLEIADLNGDLLPDIAVSNGEVFILFQRQNAPGTFAAPVLIAGWEP